MIICKEKWKSNKALNEPISRQDKEKKNGTKKKAVKQKW